MNLNFHVNCKDFGFTSMFSYYAIQKKIFEIVKKKTLSLEIFITFNTRIS